MSAAENKAVFLSYASQDAPAVERIADALRAAGVEVWFDKNEPLDPLGAHGLVGGDAWDQKIHRQIKECAIFVPIISANTNARAEGYFRLEWKLRGRSFASDGGRCAVFVSRGDRRHLGHRGARAGSVPRRAVDAAQREGHARDACEARGEVADESGCSRGRRPRPGLSETGDNETLQPVVDQGHRDDRRHPDRTGLCDPRGV
jgi:hypothetical protein